MSAENTRHVVPVDDLIEHEIAEDCVCIPRFELVVGGGPDGHIYVHHALDGRS